METGEIVSWWEGAARALLIDLLVKNKTEIVKRWVKLTESTYADKTCDFLARVKDPFANPVGHAICQSAGEIVDHLCCGYEEQTLAKALDEILKIRSIQDFAPARAVCFIFFLKQAIREFLKDQAPSIQLYEEFLEFEVKIDNLILLAFNMHMLNREQVYQLKANELRKRSEKTLEIINRHFDRSNERQSAIDMGGELPAELTEPDGES